MYLPLLRGKREELLAIQELLEAGLLSKSIIPVIEPVSLSPTLITTIERFIDDDRFLYIVDNPFVGRFDDDMSISDVLDLPDIIEEVESKKMLKKHERDVGYRDRYRELMHNKKVKHALYMSADIEPSLRALLETDTDGVAIICRNDDEVEKLKLIYTTYHNVIELCFVPDVDYAGELECKLVLFRDRFTKEARNSDYLENFDEFFSRDHILFSRSGFFGFSDYSIIGTKYEDSGYAPYAVAIHIIYHEESSPVLRIRHFVSVSNETNKNTPLKFSEATRKLEEWLAENRHVSTLGTNSLIHYFHSGKYPGLGCVKRFSLMHHFETVGKLL